MKPKCFLPAFLATVFVCMLAGCSDREVVIHQVATAVDAKLIEEGGPYYFACFLSAANTAETRKNVHMQAVERLHESIESIHSASVMVSHADFCEHEAKWSSLIYHAKDGSGWKVPTMYVNSGEQFTWSVFTSDHPNTPEQIDFTVKYQAMKKDLQAAFIEAHGIANYESVLRNHIENELGMKSAFVSSGAWLELYFRE